MDHRASPRHVRVPVVGPVSVRVLTRLGCALGAVVAAVVLSLVPLWLAHHDATTAADELQQANDAVSSQQMGDAQQALAKARGTSTAPKVI